MPITATVYAITRPDGKFYTHGYPGSWDEFPKLQIYQNRSAASRQANKMSSAVVVPLSLTYAGVS